MKSNTIINLIKASPRAVAESSIARVGRHLLSAAAGAMMMMTGVAQAAPLDYQLDLSLTMSGEQSWHSELQQVSNATTTQAYEISSQLRSDGVRYADNLLDTNFDHRMEIKQDYVIRQGLLALKRENGGKLPANPEDAKAFSDRVQQRLLECKSESGCDEAEMTERFAALGAMQSNSMENLNAFLTPPTAAPGSGFYYFFGYDGCRNRIHVTNTTHIAGRRAFDREHKHVQNFVVDRSADSAGNPLEQKEICKRYTVTVDVKTGEMFVENTYLPSPHGTLVRSIDGAINKSEIDVPVPAEVLNWSTAKLRQAPSSGNTSVELRMTTPLDGDASGLGLFDGPLRVKMIWSFKPVSATPAK